MKETSKEEVPDTWWNSRQAAEYLKISKGQLMNLTSNGRLPYYKLGRSNRYRKQDLDNYILANRRGPEVGD